MKIDNLLYHGQWDREAIFSLFWDIDRDVILNIPIGRRNYEDKLIWYFDSRGLYSVRSGYGIIMEDKKQACFSLGSNDRKWWGLLWNLNIPIKIKKKKNCGELFMVLSPALTIW